MPVTWTPIIIRIIPGPTVNLCQCVHSERDRVGESERASAVRASEGGREGGRDTEMTVNDALRHRGREEGRERYNNYQTQLGGGKVFLRTSPMKGGRESVRRGLGVTTRGS
jgi:hypothetical protein